MGNAFETCCEEVLGAEKKHNLISIWSFVSLFLFIVIWTVNFGKLILKEEFLAKDVFIYFVIIISFLTSLNLISHKFISKNIENLLSKQKPYETLVMIKPFVEKIEDKYFLSFQPFHGNIFLKYEISEEIYRRYNFEFKHNEDNLFMFSKHLELFDSKYIIDKSKEL